MNIQCECGKFQAELEKFPRNTPGRLICYCDDCQTYLHYLGRTDLLDNAGGTEIIPCYPSEMKILQGTDVLKCLRLSPKGLYRWSTSCCNTPIANTKPGFPWVGLIHRVYTVLNPASLEQLGQVKSRVQGRFARGTIPVGISKQLGFKDAMVVLPFILKGFLMSKSKNSPFFEKDGVTPIIEPKVISLKERETIRNQLGFY